MMRDIVSNMHLTESLIAATRTADASGTGVDLQGYSAAAFLVALGNSGDTLSGSVLLTVKLEESDDNSAWSAIAAADLVIPSNAPAGLAAPASLGLVYTCDAPTEDSVMLTIGYRGSARYVRVVLDFTGTHTNGIPCGAWVMLSDPAYGPAA